MPQIKLYPEKAIQKSINDNQNHVDELFVQLINVFNKKRFGLREDVQIIRVIKILVIFLMLDNKKYE